MYDGSFYKVKCKIRDSFGLREFLVDNAPLDVYYSTACWLNPHLIASRLNKDILTNIFISCDLSFDIDVSPQIKNLEEARYQAINLNDFLVSKGFKVRYSAFSGSKGFHVVCDDPWRLGVSEEDPLKREMNAIAERKKIVQEVKEKGIRFDAKVTMDTRRIIRVPGTINSKTGLVCTVLDRDELESDLEAILKLAARDRFFTPRISLRLREMTAPSAYKISGVLGRLGVRPVPQKNLYYSTFFTNNIPGTRLKIPVLEFEGWMKRERVFSVVEKVQLQYGLGDVYLFEDDERFWGISLKAVSQRRVEKILFSCGSVNYNQCKKYGCTYTRVGKSIGVEGEILQREPRFIKVLELDLLGQASRTHFEFLSSLGVTFRENTVDFCGASKEKLELI
ncbi:MAG: hypothetical protein NT066_08155, partial [Candidatus Omnitrophica bacterium]|nr:hypothetical protein [Candidatus Omnitrophota bacterium]